MQTPSRDVRQTQAALARVGEIAADRVEDEIDRSELLVELPAPAVGPGSGTAALSTWPRGDGFGASVAGDQ